MEISSQHEALSAYQQELYSLKLVNSLVSQSVPRGDIPYNGQTVQHTQGSGRGLSRCKSKQTKENHEGCVAAASCPPDIQTRNLPNTK